MNAYSAAKYLTARSTLLILAKLRLIDYWLGILNYGVTNQNMKHVNTF